MQKDFEIIMFKKINLLLVFILACLFCASCGGGSKPAAGLPKNDASGQPPYQKNIAPVADAEVAVIEMEKPVFGRIVIELYPNVAPKMVERFKTLIKEGFYDGTAFHRINPTVVQGGDPLSKGDDPRVGTGKSGKPNVPAEFSDIPYDTGIVGAARLGTDINSQDCQFFMMLKREAQFDKGYTVFGKVIDGMGNVRTIAGVPKAGAEKPAERVVIKSVTLQPHP
jgi:cyclophilin family peptidyl-prolyl cis-trans isomerase